VNKYDLSFFDETFFTEYSKNMIGYTWSMIADFIGKIHEEITFRKTIGEDQTMTVENIKKIFSTLHVSREDFEDQS
jgi:hypothetical protein